MLFRHKPKINYEAMANIVPSSKFDLKMQCIAIARGNVEEAERLYKFLAGTTKYDKWVAFNLAKSDFCKKFDDAQILQIGYLFFFADEDWGSNSKVWQYVACKNGL